MKQIPAWAMAGVIALTLPLTGWLLVNKVGTIEGKVTEAHQSIQALVGVVAAQKTELEVLSSKQEASDKFFTKAIDNQNSIIMELQRINRTIKSGP